MSICCSSGGTQCFEVHPESTPTDVRVDIVGIQNRIRTENQLVESLDLDTLKIPCSDCLRTVKIFGPKNVVIVFKTDMSKVLCGECSNNYA